MMVARCKIVVLAAVILLAIGIMLPSGSAKTAASTPMLADDAATWTKLLESPRDFQGVLDQQVEVIKANAKTRSVLSRGSKKVERAASAVALLGNIGAKMLEGDDAKKAVTLREAGLALMEAAKKRDLDAVKASLAVVESFPKSIEAASEASVTPWTEVISLDMLMKLVSAIDTAAAETAKSSKEFTKNSRELAHQSKLLALLSVVAREHNEAKDWKGWCDEMRAGSEELFIQFGKKSQKGAEEAYNTLQKSCTECHEVYRME